MLSIAFDQAVKEIRFPGKMVGREFVGMREIRKVAQVRSNKRKKKTIWGFHGWATGNADYHSFSARII